MTRQGFTVWFTGLPCSGKSTLAALLQKELQGRALAAEILDGDEVRQRLTKGLGFSREDRQENIRRIAYVAKVVTRVGGIAITAAISPYLKDREEARREIGRFVEVYVDCPLEICMQRDCKGLYAKAKRGMIPNLTGINDPYEPPEDPEVIVRTALEKPEESTGIVLMRLKQLGYLYN